MNSIIKTKITNPLQALAFAAQVILANNQFLDADASKVAMAAIAALQTVTAILQAYKNPNGTPAQTPWQPGKTE